MNENQPDLIGQEHLDKISLRQLHIWCIIGLYPEERKHVQKLDVDIDLWLDVRSAAMREDLSMTVDYALLANKVRFILQKARYFLLETAAESICHFVISSAQDIVKAVRVRLKKPKALAGCSYPALTCCRHVADVLNARKAWKPHESYLLSQGLQIVFQSTRHLLIRTFPEALDVSDYAEKSGVHLARQSDQTLLVKGKGDRANAQPVPLKKSTSKIYGEAEGLIVVSAGSADKINQFKNFLLTGQEER